MKTRFLATMSQDIINNRFLEESVFAIADGYCVINLTKNIVRGSMYQVVNGKKYNLNEQLGLPENSSLQSLVDAWALTIPEEGLKDFLHEFDRERLLNRFENGAEVETVKNGLEAVQHFEACESGTYDVILMDVMMPVMDGLTATKTIRSLERQDAKTIPIIAMTANAFREDAEKCMEAGMNAHLAKPLDDEKIKQTISEELRKQNACHE